MSKPTFFRVPPALCLLLAAAFALPAAAQTAQPAKVTKAAKAAPAAVQPAAAPVAVPDAGPDQIRAADMVYYGRYDCEFSQVVDIFRSADHPAYVDLKHGNGQWLMKPVLSPTGAIRLEDVRGETLLVQIASKSMLLNVKTSHRIVDACVSPRQRELNEQAKSAKATTPS